MSYLDLLDDYLKNDIYEMIHRSLMKSILIDLVNKTFFGHDSPLLSPEIRAKWTQLSVDYYNKVELRLNIRRALKKELNYDLYIII